MSSVRRELALPADPSATERLGQCLGERLRAGDVVGLVGELGAGKTTFVRGLARGLGTEDPDAVCSPTYLLVVEHPGRVRLLHADAYLPAKLQGFLDDGGLDYLLDPRAVIVVEWADRIPKHLPESTLWVSIDLAPDGGRQVVLAAPASTRFGFLATEPMSPAAAAEPSTEPAAVPDVGQACPRQPRT
jgi:tRNA threonylcarbamoyladenosine biosynthesis protein TsaE